MEKRRFIHPTWHFIETTEDGRIYSYVSPCWGGAYLPEPVLVPLLPARKTNLTAPRLYVNFWFPWRGRVSLQAARVAYECYSGEPLPFKYIVRYRDNDIFNLSIDNLVAQYNPHRPVGPKKVRKPDLVCGLVNSKPGVTSFEVEQKLGLSTDTARTYFSQWRKFTSENL